MTSLSMLMPSMPHGAPPHVPHDLIDEGPWWLAWNLDPQYLIPVVLLAFLYVRGLARWEGRSREHSPWRTASYLGGLLLLVLIYESPLDPLGEHHFSMHMVQHSIAMMIVPPLIYLGAPTTPILRGLPKGFRQAVVAPALNHPLTRRVWGFLTYPVMAIALFVGLQWGWHLIPGWYDAALNSDAIHDAQHITLLAVAMLFWWNIVDPKPRRSRISMGLRILYFYGAMLPKHFLAAMITFAPEPFYPTYERVELILPGTPLSDQQLAGLLMWIPFGEAINLTVAGIIFAVWWRHSEAQHRAEEARRDAVLGAPAVPGA
ncbi:MAG: cytochrome c oxidase assembly protein [Dehalococcoidia bacterium]